QSRLPLASQSLQVVRVKDSFAKPRGEHIINCKARIIERRLVGIQRHTGWVQDDNCLRYCVRYPAKLTFIFSQLFFCLLESIYIRACPVPPDKLASLVPEWLNANEKPTKDTVI